MQRKVWNVVAAVVATVCTGAVSHAQVVNNPGFESPVLQNTDALQGNWGTFYGGPITATLVAVEDLAQAHTGLYSFHVRVANDLNAFCGAAQRVSPIGGGNTYTFKYWGKKGGDTNPIGTGGVNGIDVKIEWKNSAGFNTGAIDTFHPILTDDWQQFTHSVTAPGDAVAAVIVFAVQSFTFLNPATAGAEGFFDDVEFTALATSPGACCIVSTGGCAVVSSSICSSLGGAFQGAGSTCATPCPAGCSADFDGVGGVDVTDLFGFLDAWFAQQGTCP